MATLVEVTQKKPAIQDVTLKLSRSEAADLKMFIEDWYKRNYTGLNLSYYRDRDQTFNALKTALDGKADASVVKVPASLY